VDPERHRRVVQVFAAVCDLEPAARTPVLERECAGDPELRESVESLLRHDRTRSGDVFAHATPPGPRVGDFRIVREIGRGGMGVVYEAVQLSLSRSVALKTLPPGLGLTAQSVSRFQREAKAAAKLHHTHIVPVYAVGEEQGCHFYAMELVDGRSLAAVLHDLKDGRNDPLLGPVSAARPDITSLSDAVSGSRSWFDTIARLVADVAEALHYAHGKGIVHRDVKPANLLLSRDGRLCVADFGLALVAQEPGMTLSGSLMGTPSYMAPEQVSGRSRVDPRTDVYALGTVLYEMLTLRRPFEEAGREELLSAILSREPAPPRRVNSRVPLDLETICLKAIEKDPDRRYQSAHLLAEDLRAYLSHRPLAARRMGLGRRAAKWTRRHPVATTATAASVLLLALGAVAVEAGRRGSLAEAGRLVAAAEVDLREGTYRAGLEKVERALAAAPGLPDARNTRGRLLLGMRKLRELAELAREVLESEPENWEAHGWMAFAGKASGHPDAYFSGRESGLADILAEEHAEAVERLAPDSAEAWYVKGLAARTATDAVRCFDQALERDPGHAWALLARGQAHRDLCDFPAAIADIERFIAVRPRSPQGRRELAMTHVLGFHDARRAMAEFDRAVAIDPRDALTYYERSWANYQLHQDIAKQLEDLSRAVELDPRDPLLLGEQAYALNRLARHEEALVQARRAVEIEPDRTRGHLEVLSALWGLRRRDELRAAMNDQRARADRWRDRRAASEIYRALSRHHLLLGDTGAAIAAASRAVELDPDNPVGYRRRAEARRQSEGPAGLEQECRLIAALRPHEPQPLLTRGTTLHELCGWLETVNADVDRVIEIAPAWADSHSFKGDGYTIVGRHAEALPHHDKAIEFAPSWSGAYASRARSLAGLGRWQEALADLERAFALGGEWTSSRARHALVLARLGREKEAIAAADRIVGLQPDREFGYRGRAVLQFNFGRVEEAIASLDEAIAAQPSEWLPHGLRAIFSCYTREPDCTRILEDARRAERLLDPGPSTWGSVAWFHAAHLWGACPAVADLPRALDLARRASASSPDDRQARYALGVGQYRSERYEESRRTLEAALRGDEASEDLVAALCTLAMADWKLGRRTEARAAYDRALQALKTQFPGNPVHRRFLDEAASVLGMKPALQPAAASPVKDLPGWQRPRLVAREERP
jgi:serine/threonine protein kinase/Tfp pilus assembly protein PilF